jgi:hypothetical protein
VQTPLCHSRAVAAPVLTLLPRRRQASAAIALSALTYFDVNFCDVGFSDSS